MRSPYRMITAMAHGADCVQPKLAYYTHTQHELLRNCASVGTGPV
jgi:hypothetical protein